MQRVPMNSEENKPNLTDSTLKGKSPSGFTKRSLCEMSLKEAGDEIGKEVMSNLSEAARKYREENPDQFKK